MGETLRRAGRVGLLCFTYDGLAFALALYGASLVLGYQPTGESFWGEAALAATCFGGAAAASMVAFGLHRRVWRFVTVQDAFQIAQATLLATLLFLSLSFLTGWFESLPRGAPFLGALLGFAAVTIARLARRWTIDGDFHAAWRAAWRVFPSDDPPAVIIGPSEGVAQGLDAVLRRKGRLGYRPMAIIDVSGAVVGRSISGVPVVGGLAELPAALKAAETARGKAEGPVRLIFTTDFQDRIQVTEALAAAGQAKAIVSRFRAKPNGETTQPVDPADLLPRTAHVPNEAAARALITGKRVLVTGAGGTIGGEIVRQVAELGPAKLILFEASEFNLYSINLEIAERGRPLAVSALLGDIRDPARVEEIFAAERPEIVFHAAALKHVPLMEENPAEAILTNVVGTRVVADAAASHGAEAFVLISTDKAVNPSNVMGRTKRVAELYVQALAKAYPGQRFETVRFGNVLGSAGSVVPLFERQISRGGPVTITHRDMTRYFMTVQEAASLVIQAAALPPPEQGLASSVYVLDMGEPVSIMELARQMIRMKGFEPDRDVKIKVTGLRPGEKITEEIFYPEEAVRRSSQPGVLIADAAMAPLSVIGPQIEALMRLAVQRDRPSMLSLLDEIAALRPGRARPALRPVEAVAPVDKQHEAA